MSTTSFFTLKKTDLNNNNCPECYSKTGLELTIKQKNIENTFYKAITTETNCSIHCNSCDTQIFPVRWTDEIERIVDYKKRVIQPKPKSFKLKPLAWLIIFFDAILVVVIVLFALGLINFN